MAKSAAGYLAKANRESKVPDELKPGPNIAAIDFGTSSVSLAYCIDNQTEVQTFKIDNDFDRVPNAILIKKPEVDKAVYEVEAFGYLAHMNYAQLSHGEKHMYIYFERVKALLKRDKEHAHKICRETQVMSYTNEPYYLVEVIAFIINYLKEQFLNSLTTSDGKPTYNSIDFDWVLTVPAIWNASSKRMMREAAYMAGLTSNGPVINKFTRIGDEIRRPQEINPNKLFLAIEPEVAAIFAQFKNASSTAKSTQKTEPPKRYMVVDIGGGTVDITVHDIKDGKIDVVLPPNGNTWGGFTVNEAFEEMLGEVVDDKGFSKYQKKHPDESMSTINNLIYMEVENQKKKLGNAKDLDKSFVIKLPDSFVKCYGKNTITKQFKKMPKFEFEQNHGNLRIEYIEAKEKFLKDTIGKIVEIILNSFQRYNEKVEVIYLVGGFGSCAMMQNEIKKAIENSKGHRFDEIICPHTPNLAVVKGAVMWRQDPSVIHSRRANATYGLEVAPIFDESKHDKDYQFKDEDGNLRCHHVFQVFIEEGEPAKIDEVLVSTICPPSQGDTQMFIPLYSSSRPGIQYTRDIKDGQYIVEQIGQLIIDIPNDSGKPREERLVKVSMSFSGPEICAKAKYTVTGEEVNVVCDFLSQRPEDTTNKKYAETAV